MSNASSANSIGRLGEVVRSILFRINPLEQKAGQHDADIQRIKEKLDAAQVEIDKLRKVTDHQGGMLAENERALEEVTKTVGSLEAQVEQREQKIKSLKSTVHGEQIKRGKATAHAAKLENQLSRRRK